MKRVSLPLLLLIVTTSAALAAMPCKTREEAMAEAVVGFFLVQKVAAGSCDELLGGTALAELDGRIAEAYGTQVADATRVRAAYFERAYGEGWQAELKRVDALMNDPFAASLAIDAESCTGLKGALEGRLSAGWQPIHEHLVRRVEGIVARDANICEP